MNLACRRLLFPTRTAVLSSIVFGLSTGALADPSPGIQPLEPFPQSDSLPMIADPAVRPLLTPTDQEHFLNELDEQPPDWGQLSDRSGEELGSRLFAFNRQRDAAREGHPLLSQRVAFWWSGILGEYRNAHRGFTVVMGPEFTRTTWGLVRFKPEQLPNEMIAVPSAAVLRRIRDQRAGGEPVSIGILLTGTLIPWESIIYAFSHDGQDQGLIMPVVRIEAVRYFLHPPSE